MFYIAKIVSAFLLPPGIFILALLLITVYAFYRKLPCRKYLACLTLCMYLLAAGFFSRMLLLPLENVYLPVNRQAQAIVILGGGAVVRDNFLHPEGFVSPHAAGRLLTGAELYHRQHVPVLVSGGVAIPGTGNEGIISKGILLNLGINKEDLIIESKARNTKENADNIMSLLDENNISSIYLVTSAFHMPRSMLEFQRAKGERKLDIIPYSCDYQTNADYEYSIFSFLPQQSAFDNSVLALHEYLGIAFYKIKEQLS